MDVYRQLLMSEISALDPEQQETPEQVSTQDKGHRSNCRGPTPDRPERRFENKKPLQAVAENFLYLVINKAIRRGMQD